MPYVFAQVVKSRIEWETTTHKRAMTVTVKLFEIGETYVIDNITNNCDEIDQP